MTPQQVTYRLGTPADLHILCELGQQLNRLHHEMRPNTYVEATLDFRRDAAHWLPSLRHSDHGAYIAEQGDEPAGFITLRLVRPTSPLMQPQRICRIESVCVLEARRGRGIGRELMSLAQSWATEHGASDIGLTVWTFNENAIRLYEEMGYEVRAFEMGKRTPVAVI